LSYKTDENQHVDIVTLALDLLTSLQSGIFGATRSAYLKTVINFIHHQ